MPAVYLISFTCKILLEIVFHKNQCHLSIAFAFDVEIVPQTQRDSKDNMHTLLNENHHVGVVFCAHCPNAGDWQRGKKKKITCRELTVGE